MSRTLRIAAAAALLLAALHPSAASAGIEPSPFHVVIWNRSDALAPTSPFFMQNMVLPRLYVAVQVDSAGAPATRVLEVQLDVKGIAPGGSFALDLDLTQVGGSVVGWGFTARMGVGPSPFDVCALPEPAPSLPAQPPILPAAILSDFGLYAFASPGTLVGEVVIASGALSACPAEAPWKSHGQYVRCVALEVGDLAAAGGLAEDAADAAVSAAARSGVGK